MKPYCNREHNNTWSWTWTWSDLSCGHFTIRSFSCCDTILLEKCENSYQKCAKVLQPNTTTGHEPDHIYLAVTLLSDPFHVVTQFCGNSCQKSILMSPSPQFCKPILKYFLIIQNIWSWCQVLWLMSLCGRVYVRETRENLENREGQTFIWFTKGVRCYPKFQL